MRFLNINEHQMKCGSWINLHVGKLHIGDVVIVSCEAVMAAVHGWGQIHESETHCLIIHAVMNDRQFNHFKIHIFMILATFKLTLTNKDVTHIIFK